MSSAPRNPAIELTSITYRYPQSSHYALDGLSLTISQGEWVSIVGDNGSGKSTVARIMAGLSHPDQGQVSLLGSMVFDSEKQSGQSSVNYDAYDAAREKISIVFQNPLDQIVSSLVDDDVAFGPENLGLNPRQISQRVTSSLNQTGMAAHAKDDPLHLSGGQQQRVTISSALAMNPQILILDEPTAMIDASGRQSLMKTLAELHKQGLTIIMITHNRGEALLSDRIIELDHGHLRRDEDPQSYRQYLLTTQYNQAELSTNSASALSYAQVFSHTDEEITDQAVASLGIQAEHISTWTNSSVDLSFQDRGKNPVLSLSEVSYRYPSNRSDTLHNLSLTVNQGDYLAVVGPNGAGKSTLALIMCALGKPSKGKVFINGLDAFARKNRKIIRSHIGYVMQHPENQLFAETVADDIAYGPKNLGMTAQETADRTDQVLQLLGISHLKERAPWDLSGGERRLAAIAGVLINNPDIIVLDEPTVGLDARASQRILSLLKTLRSQGKTIIVITHSLPLIAHNASRVVFLDTKEKKPVTPADRRIVSAEAHDSKEAHGSRNSVFSSCDPRSLILSTIAVMLSSLAISNLPMLLWGYLLIALAIGLSRVSLKDLWLQLHGFMWIFLFMGLVNAFFVQNGRNVLQWGFIRITDQGLWTAFIYPMRFILMIALGFLLIIVIPPMRMSDAFESLIRPLRLLSVPTHDVAFVLTLGLRFVPIITGEFLNLGRAQIARGGSIGTGSLLARVRSTTSLLVPVLGAAIRHAHNLSLALDARCYKGPHKRTSWHPLAFSYRDGIVAALVAAWMIILVFFKLHFPGI